MRNSKGFTLMELLVSLVIMSVIMLALAYAFMLVKQRNLQDLMRHKAEETIQGVFSTLRTIDFDDIKDQYEDVADEAEINEIQNLNIYCNPADDNIPDEEFRGRFVFRNSSGAQVGSVPYEVVIKVFEGSFGSGAGGSMDDTKTVIATICWQSKNELKYLTRKSVILKEGML